MSKLAVKGHASGTGTVTVEAPNTSTNRAITLPDAAGEILLSDGDGSSLTGISHTPEGTAVKSTGEAGGTKFLREDGDGTCSWQAAGATGMDDVSGVARATSGLLFGSDTAAANKMDDYEEGEVTTGVYISDGTNNATMEAGKNHLYYTKIGNLVTVTGYIGTTSLGSVSGNITVTGLPFAVTNDNAAYSSVLVGYGSNLNITATQTITGYAQKGQSYLYLTLWDSASGTSILQDGEWSSDGKIIFSVTYRTNS